MAKLKLSDSTSKDKSYLEFWGTDAVIKLKKLCALGYNFGVIPTNDGYVGFARKDCIQKTGTQSFKSDKECIMNLIKIYSNPLL